MIIEKLIKLLFFIKNYNFYFNIIKEKNLKTRK